MQQNLTEGKFRNKSSSIFHKQEVNTQSFMKRLLH